jgi:hypothetical protein
MLNVEAAKTELASKSFKDIQQETAWKWASRAAAAYQLVLSANDADIHKFMLQASDYFGEAREHSADVGPKLLIEINEAVGPYMMEAWKILDKKAGF